MTPYPKKRNDTKLLLGVAGAVVAGVAAIALLAGLHVDRNATAGPSRESRASAPAAPPAMPAMIERAPALQPELEPLEVVEEPAGEFTVDPDANFVARGLEAWGSREFARAAGYFEAEIEARPQRSWTHYMHGLSLWKAGRIDSAELAMGKASRLDPDSIRSLVNLSRIRNDQADFDGALEAARSARALDAAEPSALFLEGRSLYNLGRFDEAVTALSQSVAIDPDNGYVQNLLGLTHIRQGRAGEAIDPLERAALVEPDVPYIRNNLGMALELDGRASAAVAAYRRGSELEPGGKAALNLARLEPAVEPILTAAVADADDEAIEPATSVADETVEVALAEVQETGE